MPKDEDEVDEAMAETLERVDAMVAFCRPLSTDILEEMRAVGVDAMEFARQHARERIKAGFEARN
jgi:hypothetical protein